MARVAYLALGSNLGDREVYLRAAIARLRMAPGVNFLRASSIYETEPIGVTDQPRFLNMVVELAIEDSVTPRDLLGLARRIEAEVGRTQRERWGPREVDIDILLVGDERVKEDDFQVPHPRMWERAFVMAPLAELAPELKGPGGETAAGLARGLSQEEQVRPHTGLVEGVDHLIASADRPQRSARHGLGEPRWDMTLALLCLAVIGLDAVGAYRLILGGPSPTWLAGVCLAPVSAISLAVVFVQRGMRSRWWCARLLLLVAVVMLPTWYFGLGGDWECFNRGLRARVTSKVDLRELRSAGLTLLEQQQQVGRNLTFSRREIEESPLVPDAIRALRPRQLFVTGGADRQKGAVCILLGGGGFAHYGVIITPPGAAPRHGPSLRAWREGVYGGFVDW